MPTYAFTTMKGLTQDQRERIVESVTAIHSEEATAPRYFVQVVFYDVGPGAMFIGGGPGGTAGGIKVTTFAVLFFILMTELRGEGAVNIFGKRLSRAVHRQAITVVLLAVAAVMAATVLLMLLTGRTFDVVLFEVISAFATVGLSTGITPEFNELEQAIIVVLMFAGRLGPLTVGSAIALRDRRILYELPKERPAIG